MSIPQREHGLLAGILVDAVAAGTTAEDARQAALRVAGQHGRELGMAERSRLRPGRLGAERALTLACGTSRDVTIIEAAAAVVPCAQAPDPIAQCYAARTGWDPRHEDAPHVYLVATPRTMRAWKSLAEINGRTIMRDGRWTPA